MTRRSGGWFRSVGVMFTVGALMAAGCGEPASAPMVEAVAARGGQGGPVVSSFAPSQAPQHITIDITVKGSGFSPGASVRLEQNGVSATNVITNSTAFISSTQLVANITITEEASADYYDVAVISGGKRGVGAEQFEVLDVVWVGPLDGQRLYQATDINSQGHVAGWSGNAAPFFYGGGSTAEWLQGDLIGFPSGINDHDQVVGNACDWSQAVNPSCGYADQHGVIWQRSGSGWQAQQVTQPGNLVVDITNDGELFGLEPAQPLPWRRRTDLTTEYLPLPPGRTTAYLNAANNTGQAAGSDLFWSLEVDGFPKVLVLPSPTGATGPTAADLSDMMGDEVWVAGSALFKGYRKPVRWRLSRASGSWQLVSAERLGVPFTTRNYGEGVARGVNADGNAVGFAYDAGGVARPIKWLPSGMPLLLPYPKGSANSMAFAINKAGWVAGYVEGPYPGAVVWRVP